MFIIQTEKTMWLALFIYWVISSFSVKKSVKKQVGWQRMTYIAFVFLAFAFLFQDLSFFPFLNKPFLPQRISWKILGLIGCTIGLAFSLSARIYLGKNWSARITIKKDHELIQSGPYRITRNPIYTGFLVAYCGSSMSLGQVKGYLGIFLLLTCLLIKISTEEKFMLEVFSDRYRNYQAKVKKLIPFIY